MIRTQVTAISALIVLGACSAGTGFFGGQNDLFIGTNSASSSANGLPFAIPGAVLADLESEGEIKVKVVRSYTDWESGTTRLLISDEKLTLGSNSTSNGLEDIVLTLGGETLIFVGGLAAASNGQDDWRTYIATSGAVSGVGALYSYEDSENVALSGEFDSEGFFTFGYETDPDEIVALVGSVIYNGSFNGYGQTIDPSTGNVVSSEQEFLGTITLTANFDSNDIEGTLDGTFDYSGTDFETSFSAPIEDNGYLGTLDSMTCSDAICLSNAEIGGAFFGVDGQETSGVIGMDVRVIPNVGDDYRLIGGGGFTAQQ